MFLDGLQRPICLSTTRRDKAMVPEGLYPFWHPFGGKAGTKKGLVLQQRVKPVMQYLPPV